MPVDYPETSDMELWRATDKNHPYCRRPRTADNLSHPTNAFTALKAA